MVDPENEDDWGLNEDEQFEPLVIPKRATAYKVVQAPTQKTSKPGAKDGKANDKQSPAKATASPKKADHSKTKSDSRGAKKVDAQRRIHEVEEYDADDASDIELLGSGDNVSTRSSSESMP